jgi:hypothetical protein
MKTKSSPKTKTNKNSSEKQAATFVLGKYPEGVVYRHAVRLKAPSPVIDEDTGEASLQICYIVEGGRSHFVPVTETAYKRILGARLPRAPHTGLYRKDKNLEFLLRFVSDSKRTCVGVDTFPGQFYGNKKSDAPLDRAAQKHIEAIVSASTGDVDIVELPPGRVRSRAEIRRTLEDLHSVSNLEEGTVLASKFEVLHNAGNRITIDLFAGEPLPD